MALMNGLCSPVADVMQQKAAGGQSPRRCSICFSTTGLKLDQPLETISRARTGVCHFDDEPFGVAQVARRRDPERGWTPRRRNLAA